MADRTERRGRQLYPGEFQREAVALANSAGMNVAADRLSVPCATVRNWTRWRRKMPPAADSRAQLDVPTPSARSASCKSRTRGCAENSQASSSTTTFSERQRRISRGSRGEIRLD